MDALNRESRTSVHFMVSYMLAGAPAFEQSRAVDFQKALLDNGLEFTQTNIRPRNFMLLRQDPSNLQVKLDSPGPQITGLHTIANNPTYDIDMFARDALAVTDAYRQTWPAPHYQIIRATAKVSHLYSSQEHAFKYLWETRLGQSPEDFKRLGPRPVAGGGLRLMIPPHAVAGEEPRSIEIRIESFLREPRKLLVETTFAWPQPKVLAKDDAFDIPQRLESLETYAVNEVWTFVS
ncbi:MAG: hypothetical protein IH624_15265 [Phycisphaerae bacterium]|nr:hypothetical protein [Phycisphaerae bacterium]